MTVSVKHLVTLSAVRKGAKTYFRGKVGPRHPKRLVVIQIRKGSRWVTFAKVKTTKRSTFLVVKTLKPACTTGFVHVPEPTDSTSLDSAALCVRS